MKSTFHRTFTTLTNLFVLLALVAGMFLATQPAAAATTIAVNSFLDQINSSDNLCTLREAIIAANKDAVSGRLARECQAGSGADTITLPAGTYILTRTDNGKEDASATGDLDITGDVTIVAPGTGVAIQGMSGFTDRIFHIIKGAVTIKNITIQGGKVNGDGGGIYNAGKLSLENVTLSGNSAKGNGGGLYHAGGSTTLNYVTIANNTGASQLGSIQTGSGIALTLKATLLASPASGVNCNAKVISAGYNLSSDSSCNIAFIKDNDQNGVDPKLGPLQGNGGSTLTHALLAGSPAIDSAEMRGNSSSCPATDQRGVTRPQGAACDIGAFESETQAQSGPVYTVYTNADPGDSLCTLSGCSLRAAIQAANAHLNGSTPDEVHFAIPGSGIPTIQVSAALPGITEPLVIDGNTQPGGQVVLEGSAAGAGVDGLTINAGGTTVRGLLLSGFRGSGIVLAINGGNTITGNTITGNGGSGVTILSGTNNLIEGNIIYANASLPVDLGDDGPTPNDAGDPDTGANFLQNYPVLMRAVPASGGTAITGRLNSLADTLYTLQFYASPQCGPAGAQGGQTLIGTITNAKTDSNGNLLFNPTLPVDATGQFISGTATDPMGNTSEFSPCIVSSEANDSWPHALQINASNSATLKQYIDQPGLSRWYKFTVQPGSRVLATLTGLPANYDLTLYKDIAAAFQSVSSPGDLVRLGAEFAPDAFSPDAFSPDAFSPDAFSPDAFSPDAFSPDAFSPDAFSPDAFSPDAFSPDAFSPDAFSPDAFSPDAFSPDAFSPDAFSPDAFSPDAFSPDAFSSAQTRSLIAISAFEGNAGEGLLVNTWDRSGDFYIRVRGRNGAYSLQAPFTLTVRQDSKECSSLPTNIPNLNTTVQPGVFKTVILSDLGRMDGTATEKSALTAKLASFAARPEVVGAIVNVGADRRVAALNLWADQNPACPQGKNLVAAAIKALVDQYWAQNPLEYVVIVGGDAAIPFFRHPDQALLASEKNYVPPVLDNTASQASLRLGYVLSQDRYGSKFDVSVKDDLFPIPSLAVGRLVESATEVSGMLDAYLSTSGGILPAPASALVTGYDFLADGAEAVQSELAAGLGKGTDTLITPRDVSPLDPSAWTADQLRAQLLGQRHDLVFLGGHFSAGSALAADYSTRLLTSDVISSTVDLTNALIFSAGCHAGYNLVDPHAVPRVTQGPDWAQAFARKGATLIAGTGYQYGDTDFVEYSERLYLNFARQLRVGSGPVAIGKALIAAKSAYLADTPQLRGIHEKVLLESTLFGLPMLSVNLPSNRLGNPGGSGSIVPPVSSFNTNPGQALGLGFADVTVNPSLTTHTVTLNDTSSTATTLATYLGGSNGAVSRPAEPVLPLEVRDVSASNTVLRGVGFRSGTYSDTQGIFPLTGAASTEIRGVHPPFLTDIFYPVSLWNVNYFDALPGLGRGITRLMLTPAQYISSAPGATDGILRSFSDLNFRLYYSSNTTTYTGASKPSTPALAAAPAIVRTTAFSGSAGVNFQVRVAGNPAAGIQEVWVTYTAATGSLYGRWQSLGLVQSSTDSTLWEGTLPPGSLNGTDPKEIRYMAQAVNGVGLVSLATNQGRYYIPDIDTTPTQTTALTLGLSAPSGAYGTQATLNAVLTSSGAPLAGKPVYFSLGAQRRLAITDSAGQAAADLPLLGIVDAAEAQVSFQGDENYAPSSDSQPFTITKQATTLLLEPAVASGYASDPNLIVATLADAAGRPLPEKTVVFVLDGGAGPTYVASITNFSGQAVLGSLSLPPGSYTVNVYFGGSFTLPGNGTSTSEPITFTLDDERYQASSTTGSLTLLNPPNCTNATLSPVNIWPVDNTFRPVTVNGVTDGDGDPITITITSIFQDEPVGTGPQSPDGLGVGTATAQLRAERDGTGDGRVYHVGFNASDGHGGVCSAVKQIGVVENQSMPLKAIDGGPLYDSTVPGN